MTLSQFDESDRWYITSGATSAALFYDQSSAVSNAGRQRIQEAENDPSTPEQHRARYGGGAIPASAEKFCSSCGQKCPASANFCPKCGARF